MDDITAAPKKMPEIKTASSGHVWLPGQIGINKETGGWFVCDRDEETEVASFKMQVLWGRILNDAKGVNGSYQVALRTADRKNLQLLTPKTAHAVMEKAFAEFSKPRKVRIGGNTQTTKKQLGALRLSSGCVDPVLLATRLAELSSFLRRKSEDASPGAFFDAKNWFDEMAYMFGHFAARVYGGTPTTFYNRINDALLPEGALANPATADEADDDSQNADVEAAATEPVIEAEADNEDKDETAEKSLKGAALKTHILTMLPFKYKLKDVDLHQPGIDAPSAPAAPQNDEPEKTDDIAAPQAPASHVAPLNAVAGAVLDLGWFKIQIDKRPPRWLSYTLLGSGEVLSAPAFALLKKLYEAGAPVSVVAIIKDLGHGNSSSTARRMLKNTFESLSGALHAHFAAITSDYPENLIMNDGKTLSWRSFDETTVSAEAVEAVEAAVTLAPAPDPVDDIDIEEAEPATRPPDTIVPATPLSADQIQVGPYVLRVKTGKGDHRRYQFTDKISLGRMPYCVLSEAYGKAKRIDRQNVIDAYYGDKEPPKTVGVSLSIAIGELRDALAAANAELGLGDAGLDIVSGKKGIFVGTVKEIAAMENKPAVVRAPRTAFVRAARPVKPARPERPARPAPAPVPPKVQTGFCFHPQYGLGGDMGAYEGGRKFRTLGGHDVEIADNQIAWLGYGALLRDRYRDRLHDSVVAANRNNKTRPDTALSPADIEALFNLTKQPDDLYVLLQAALLHGNHPQAFAMQNRIARFLAREMSALSPFLNADETATYLKFLAGHTGKLDDTLLWPFDRQEHFAHAFARVSAWQAKHAGASAPMPALKAHAPVNTDTWLDRAGVRTRLTCEWSDQNIPVTPEAVFLRMADADETITAARVPVDAPAAPKGDTPSKDAPGAAFGPRFHAGIYFYPSMGPVRVAEGEVKDGGERTFFIRPLLKSAGGDAVQVQNKVWKRGLVRTNEDEYRKIIQAAVDMLSVPYKDNPVRPWKDLIEARVATQETYDPNTLSSVLRYLKDINLLTPNAAALRERTITMLADQICALNPDMTPEGARKDILMRLEQKPDPAPAKKADAPSAQSIDFGVFAITPTGLPAPARPYVFAGTDIRIRKLTYDLVKFLGDHADEFHTRESLIQTVFKDHPSPRDALHAAENELGTLLPRALEALGRTDKGPIVYDVTKGLCLLIHKTEGQLRAHAPAKDTGYTNGHDKSAQNGGARFHLSDADRKKEARFLPLNSDISSVFSRAADVLESNEALVLSRMFMRAHGTRLDVERISRDMGLRADEIVRVANSGHPKLLQALGQDHKLSNWVKSWDLPKLAR